MLLLKKWLGYVAPEKVARIRQKHTTHVLCLSGFLTVYLTFKNPVNHLAGLLAVFSTVLNPPNVKYHLDGLLTVFYSDLWVVGFVGHRTCGHRTCGSSDL